MNVIYMISHSDGKEFASMWETWVWSLGWEDALEEGMATHCSILAWRYLHGLRRLAGYNPWGLKELDMIQRLSTAQHTIIYMLYAIFTHSYQPGSVQHMFTTLCHLIHLFDGLNSIYSSVSRRKWQPTPVFLPGEPKGQRSLVGCCLWVRQRVGHNWSDLAAALFCTTFKLVLIA